MSAVTETTGRTTSGIQLARQLLRPVDQDALAGKLRRVQAALAGQEQKLSGLQLGGEPRRAVKENQRALRLEQRALTESVTALRKFPAVKEIDVAVLRTLRSKEGLPLNAPFPAQGGEKVCRIAVTLQAHFPNVEGGRPSYSRTPTVVTNFTPVMEEAYRDVIGRVVRQAWHRAASAYKADLQKTPTLSQSGQPSRYRASVDLSASFGDDIIPQESQIIIDHAVKSGSFDAVYLLAEPTSWQLSERCVPVLRDLDPLVIGEKGGRLFVIHTFDLTARERFLASLS